jgi:prepilin-type N-terminal cleavage/methylation domain-containing protein
MISPNSNKGFSLIELLIVVAVVGVIAAIAVPNLLSSKRAANEASALAVLRVISSGQATYQNTAGAGQYGSLAALRTQSLVDSNVGAATIAGPGTPKLGYLFAASNIAGLGMPAFDAIAQPSVHTSASLIFSTGSRSFYVNEMGVMYFNTTDTAPTCTADDTRTVTAGAGGGALNNN